MIVTTQSQFVTSTEAAEILGVDRVTFRKYEKDGLPGGLGELTPWDVVDNNPKKRLYARQYIETLARWLRQAERNNGKLRGRPRKGRGA